MVCNSKNTTTKFCLYDCHSQITLKTSFSNQHFKNWNKELCRLTLLYFNTLQGEESGDQEDDELSELREQVETLSSSLLTLTQEKSKLEANYIAEKKTLKVNLR